MTERPNDATDETPAGASPADPDQAADTAAEVPPPDDHGPANADEVAEEAPDLTDAQLDAAAAEAEFDVEMAEDDVDADEDLEGDEELAEGEGLEVEGLEGEDLGEEATATTPKLGARARAEEEARLRREAREARERREAREARRGRFRRGQRDEEEEVRGRAPTRTPFAIDPALRIKDPASSGFVVAAILVFLLIFLNAMAFGKGGAFTVRPTPTPVVTFSPAPSTSPGTSGSPAPSGSPATSPAASPLPATTPEPAAS